MSKIKRCGMCNYKTDYLFNQFCLICDYMYDDDSNENAKVINIETEFKKIEEEVK